MIKVIALLALIPGVAFAAESAETFGPCSPIAPKNSGTITINCPGISQQQGEQMLRILNKILTSPMGSNAVMEKLDEILHEVNPNAPKTTYTFAGDRRVISPGRTQLVAGEMEEVFHTLGQLQKARDWEGLKALSEVQMREWPDWFTPYVFAGQAYLYLGQREKARQVLELAEKRIAGNPDYQQLERPLTNMLKELRGR